MAASRTPSPRSRPKAPVPQWRLGLALLGLGAVLFFFSRPHRTPSPTEEPPGDSGIHSDSTTPPNPGPDSALPPNDASKNAPTKTRSAAEEVRERHSRFLALQRRRLAEYAAAKGIPVPKEVLDFFAAAETGSFDELRRLYLALQADAPDSAVPVDVRRRLQPLLLEVFGVEEQIRKWPPEALLAYGRQVLDSIPAGSVYLGGTDEGRFIPAFLNDTSPEPLILLTQNGLANLSYQEYVRFVHGDRVQMPSQDVVDAAFARVLQEQGVVGADGRRTMSGGRAVMAINDRLVRAIADLNPDLRFAVQESGPMPSTYPGASLNGALYQFGVPVLSPTDSELAAMAGAAAERWSQFAAQLPPPSDPSGTDPARSAAAQLISGQASVLQARGLTDSAWNLYGIALQVSPGSHGLRVLLAGGLIEAGRYDQARQVLDAAPIGNPSGQEALDRLREMLPPGKP